MFQNHRDFFLLLAIFILPSISLTSSSDCNQSCYGATPDNVPYPFGFSEGCQIRLNCNNGNILIGQFQVQNVTPDNLLVKIPENCNRPIKDLMPLFDKNYALTLQNGLLLRNCSSPPKGCEIPTALMETQFQFGRCDPVYCFSKGDEHGKSDFMTFSSVSQSSCEFVFSSIAVDAANMSSSVSLQFQRVELGWWLEGNCNCSPNATCTEVISPFNRQPGFRCRCLEGYEGDGFLSGRACRKVQSNCGTTPKYIPGSCGGTTRFGLLIGGIVAGASLVTGMALLFYYIKLRSISSKTRKSTKQLLSKNVGSSSVPFYAYKEIERATYGFSEKHMIGTGAYGTVYAGKLNDDASVAIKRIRHRDKDGMEQFMNEIKLLSSVSHPNLVQLLGFCLERGEQILIYEYMPNGTLSQHLQRERGTSLPWTIRLNIATETAQAIAHLHSSMDPPIYHRDIKSSNILLDFNFNSKVADFGLSRLGMTEISHISTTPQGTPGYLDPQYHQNFHLSDKSDVYSYGVVLVEIITALKVVDFSRPHSEVNLAALAVDRIGKGCVDEIIDPFLELHRDAWTLSSVLKVAELAFRCLAYHRDMRPSMMEVATELEQIKLSGWATSEDNMSTTSSMASCCSFPSIGNEKLQGMMVKKEGVESQRLITLQRENFVISTKEVKDFSPISVLYGTHGSVSEVP